MTISALETRRARPVMHALVFDGRLRLGELPRPEPGPEQVLVRVDACAVSRMDIDFAQHRRPVHVRPALLGHEFVGRVVGLGERVEAEWDGRRVVARPIPGCRRCISCRQNRPWLCDLGGGSGLGMGLVDGAFADYVVVPARSLVAVPDVLDDEETVFAYSVASVLEGIRSVKGPAPQRVLVVGDGNLGLLVTLMLHAHGHTVGVLGRHPSRRELLWRSGIAFSAVTDEMLGDGAAVPSDVRERYGVVFECSGRVSGFELAVRCLRPRGQLVLMSDHVGQPGVDLRFLVEDEIEMTGIGGGPLEPALEFLTRRSIDTLPLVSARVGLDDGVRAFDQAVRRGALRTILVRENGRG